MESEADNKLLFLDVLVQRQGNRLNTSVYRKPTHQYIYSSSCHSIQVKRGVIVTLTRRAKNICSTPQSLSAELDHLRYVFTKYNEYPSPFVTQTINNTLDSTTKPPRQQTAPFTISLPYIGSTSHHIRRLLKQQADIDVTFQRGNSIQNLLQATGRPRSSQKQDPSGVVYHIECDCGDSYVGETSRPLTLRIKEHQASVRKNYSKSAIADHIKAHPNHNIKWDKTRTIVRNQSDYKIQ
ncbi:uncharacterized protein LOC124280700 [Haliotis rubra]|uniref:uncharacterized protein LOC124280700 n=1 Tax=Haliotis rubra TaxID=36100 RepID=UPI001EE5F4A0|nr:uncharacterized protein LOC124280700 [Haliotis rubra]